MPGLYIGSTSGYSGKNTVSVGLGLAFQQAGLAVGYMKPVGAMPMETEGAWATRTRFSCATPWALRPTLPTPPRP
jgi:BioD-like phosphotransacetylase family protein